MNQAVSILKNAAVIGGRNLCIPLSELRFEGRGRVRAQAAHLMKASNCETQGDV